MSEFRFEARAGGFHEKLVCRVDPGGLLQLDGEVSDRRERTVDITRIDLPAADARRLRDWLRERYPETDTGETK